MKAKITKGKGFRGALNYILGKGEQGQIVGGNTSGETPRELAREYGAVRRLRGEVTNPVWHSSLSLPQGENLTDERWQKIVVSYLTQVGVDVENQQYTVVRHTDTEHEHAHIIVNRICLDKSIWNPRFDIYRAIEATQKIEKTFGLQQTPGREVQRLGEPSVSKGEVQKAIREERLPLKIFVGDAVKKAVEGKPTMAQFLAKMSEQGVYCKPNISKTGKVNGFAFCALGYDNANGEPIAVKGSDVKAGWKTLSEVLDYDPARDNPELENQANTDYAAWKERFVRSNTSDGVNSNINGNSVQHGSPEGTDSRGGGEGTHRELGTKAAEVGPAHRTQVAGNDRRYRNIEGDDGGSIPYSDPLEVAYLGVGSSDDSGLDGHIVTAGRIAALAGRTGVPSQGSLDGEIMKKSLELKKRKVLEQLDALGCDQYRITCKSRREGLVSFNMCRPKYNRRKDPKPAETLYTRADIDKWLPLAEWENVRGYDIYITPVDDKIHTFLLDDLTEDGLKKALETYTVAWAQRSSEDNYQAIILVPNPENTKLERRAANKMIQKLNLELGGDAKLQGVRRPFRTVAFANKKPGRNNEYTVCVHSNPRAMCPRATAELEAIRRTMASEEPERKERKAMLQRRHKQAQNIVQFRVAETSTEKHLQRRWKWHYERAVAKVQTKEWKRIRYELIDYAAARDLIQDGLDPREVLQALQRQSPGLQAGEMDPQYARQTLEAIVQQGAPMWDRRQAKVIHSDTLRFAGRLAKLGKTVLSAGMQGALDELEKGIEEMSRYDDGR